MRYLLTLDLGTTSVKTCVFDEDFSMEGYSCEEYKLLTPYPGIVELEPEIYWNASKRGIKAVLAHSGINPRDVCAITITAQGETLIPVDFYGRPLHNAVVWLDSRAEEEAALISSAFSPDEIYRTTGMSEIGPACPASKLFWFKRNEREVSLKTHKFLLLMDFIAYKLTGQFLTDRCITSSTGYLNINTGELWKDMLDFIGVHYDKIPSLFDCGTNCAGILPEVADQLGLNPGIIIATGGMDQASSAIGAGNIADGIISETTGTALVVAATSDAPDYDNPVKLNIMRHAVKGKYLILPYNQTAGMALKWFRDEFCTDEINCCETEGKSVYACLDDMAGRVSPLSNGILFLPHLAGMLTPEVNPSVKGVFFGAGLDTGKSHFIRSILEGVAYMLRENVEMLEDMGVRVDEIRSLGGGSKSVLWCEIKADINKRRIHTMVQDESTSLGAAILGSLAAGIYGGIVEACKAVKIKKNYKPNVENSVLYEQGYEKYKKLYNSLREMF